MRPKGFQKSAWAPGCQNEAFPIPIWRFYNLDKWIWIDLWSHFGSIFGPSWDVKMMKKRCVLLCFRDLGDSKIDAKIVAGKKASKWLSGAQGGKEFWPKTLQTWPGAMRVIPKGYHFKRILRKKTEKKANRRVGTRWSAKSGVQKAHTERQVQKGNPHRT